MYSDKKNEEGKKKRLQTRKEEIRPHIWKRHHFYTQMSKESTRDS